jgi:pantetheine-phosphate adenylyltransferase
MNSPYYHTIGLGGTFDHLHLGHQKFLQFASDLADNVEIGLATEKLTRQKLFAFSIQDFKQREETVWNFLQQRSIAAHIFSLNDSFGPTLKDSLIEALAVTNLTLPGAKTINHKRLELGLAELPIHICPLVPDESGEDISSTRIRAGEINRTGQVYLRTLLHLITRNSEKLSEVQKDYFKQKQGELVAQPSNHLKQKFVVGDIVLETFVKNGWPYSLGVFDQKSNRQIYVSKFLENLPQVSYVKNMAGLIGLNSVQVLVDLLQKIGDQTSASPQHLLVDGEEDLLAVILILLAPLNSAVYYGQPKEGIVEVVVTEEVKEKFREVLS